MEIMSKLILVSLSLIWCIGGIDLELDLCPTSTLVTEISNRTFIMSDITIALWSKIGIQCDQIIPNFVSVDYIFL